MKNLILAILLSLPAASFAAGVHSCEGLDSIGNLIGNVKTFSQGDVRVAYVTTEEPAAAPDHLLVFVIDQETHSFYNCYAVSADKDGTGFSGINMDGMKSAYNAKQGLLLTVPVSIFDGTDAKPASVKVRIDQRNLQNPVTLE